MKAVITGGGTGGHIYPAVAIADEIKRRDPDGEIMFIGSEQGLERDLVPKCGYEITMICADGFGRKLNKNIIAVKKIIKAMGQAKKILKDFRPDFVVGTGGYASAPVVKVAQSLGIPTFIQEQNAVPGRTNKVLEKNAVKVFLGFPKAGESFKYPEKHMCTGNPVRSQFTTTDRAASREKLGFADDQFVIMAFGGSQGAGRVNKAMLRVIEEFRDDPKCVIVMGVGGYYIDAITEELKNMGIETGGNVRIYEYIDDMATFLASADLIISRSGAISVAETTACGIPSILIPSPIVTGNHQYYNALSVAEEGGACLIEEKNLEDDSLVELIRELREDPERLAEMAKASYRCGPRDAAGEICDIIFEEIG